MSLFSKLINGQKKTIINNETKKEEEILYLFSYPIDKNDNPPSSVCEFIIGQKLGEGQFGTVRLGINRQTKEKVAIKILEKIKMTNFDDKKRLEKEINILKKIHHPNIVKLFCVIETERQIFIIMEYIKGNELFQYILMKKKLEEEEACYYFLQIINCIDYLNKLKISHRDLKAENIIIEQNTKEIRLIDFGLSNIYENNQLLSTACGSPVYAAPEMLEGKLYKGSTVDLWSAGIVLYYMLCGNFPFEDVSNDKLYKKILKGKFDIPKFLSKNVKDLLNRILVVNPQKRINIKDIKKHPWVLEYLEKNQNFSNIFKNIGLNIGKYVIPIDEDIVSEINSKYNIDKVQIRKNILYNIINDISTLYYIMLNKKSNDGIKSIADMKSDLFENYIKDKNNLLSSYNNDINKVFNKRKNGMEEENEKPEENKNAINNSNENKDNNLKNESNDKKKMKNNQSYTNVIANNENNKFSYHKKNIFTLNKQKNRCISVGQPNNKDNSKLYETNFNKKRTHNNSIQNYKKSDSNKLSLNLKKKILNEKGQSSNNKSKIRNNSSLSKSMNIKKEYNISEKKEIVKKNEFKSNLNNTVKLEDENNNNKYNNIMEKTSTTINNNLNILDSSQNKEKNNDELKENKNINNVSEFNFDENKNNEEEKNNNENTIKIMGSDESRNKDKKSKENNEENANLNYYTLNANPSSEKKEKNSKNNHYSNFKIGNNRLVIFKDTKNKNIKSKNNSLINKNENKNKNNNKVNHNKISNLKKDKDNIIKNRNISVKENKRHNSNINTDRRNDNHINHKKITKLIGKSSDSGNINNGNNGNNGENENLSTIKNKEYIKKHRNRSVEAKKENLNKYNKFFNQNSKNIKNKNINKIKININNKEKTYDIFKPIDINCIFIENEKYIKNEILKLNENKEIKIKSINNEKYNINIKSLDLLIELLIEKSDNSLITLKFKKIKGRNVDYINQLNQILNEIYNNKKKE